MRSHYWTDLAAAVGGRLPRQSGLLRLEVGVAVLTLGLDQRLLHLASALLQLVDVFVGHGLLLPAVGLVALDLLQLLPAGLQLPRLLVVATLALPRPGAGGRGVGGGVGERGGEEGWGRGMGERGGGEGWGRGVGRGGGGEGWGRGGGGEGWGRGVGERGMGRGGGGEKKKTQKTLFLSENWVDFIRDGNRRIFAALLLFINCVIKRVILSRLPIPLEQRELKLQSFFNLLVSFPGSNPLLFSS